MIFLRLFLTVILLTGCSNNGASIADTETVDASETGGDINTNGDSDIGTNSDSDTDTDSASDTRRDSDTHSDQDSDGDTATDTAMESDTDSDTGTDSGTGNDSETIGDSGSGTSADSDTGSDWDTDIDSDTQTEAEPRHIFVGNTVARGAVREDFSQYWNQITPENAGHWGSVEATRDMYNWGALDAIYGYAKDNSIVFKQSPLVRGIGYVSWINGLSSSEQAEEIEEWIFEICSRYPDTDLIDVVSEAFVSHAPASYCISAFGDDWIIELFKLARKHCADSILIINDYDVLTQIPDEFIAMVTPVVEAGVVDGIGLEAHSLEDWPLTDIETNLNKVAALGLPIYITEYDVDIADDTQQLAVMRDQFTLFYNHPSVAGMTLWGYVVGNTWLANSGLMYTDGTPRPAMTWLMDFLHR